MSKLKMAAYAALGVITVSVGFVVTTSSADAKVCRTRECVAHAPFVCKGPVGSCGFQQGACIRWRTVHYFVPGRSCAGTPPNIH